MTNRPWSSTAPPGEFRTYISAEESLKEFTVRAVILGALFGLLFGAVYWRWRRLWPLIVAHTIANLISFMVTRS